MDERDRDLTLDSFFRTADDVAEGATFIQGSRTPRPPAMGIAVEFLTPQQLERAVLAEDIHLQ